MVRSSFGRGYAVCLVQFLFHEPRLKEQVERYAMLWATKPDPAYPNLWDETNAVEMWANGAADHLIDIVRPRRWIKRTEWARAKTLSDLTYNAGRQFRGDRQYSAAEMRAALTEAEALLHSYSHAAGRPSPQTFQEAWELDVAAGLVPQRGEDATCESRIPTRTEA